MAVQNPFAGDAVLGDAWEQGFLAGYAEPETDHLRPFAPDILDAYRAGEQSGRDDRRQLPPNLGGEGSTEHSQLVEIAQDVGLHALGHGFFHMVFHQVGGLISLVLTVLQIPGDTELHPLEDDWTGPVDVPEDTFVAVCPRDDHGPMEGTTNEGYWAGPGREFFSDALADMQQHSHAEAGVARCSVPNGECGLVWPGTGH
jgi:hypothetical protein